MAASFDTFLHVTELVAVSRALITNLSAFLTKVLSMLRFHQHEMGRTPANLRTGGHQAEVLWLDMLPARLKTMGHRHAETGLVVPRCTSLSFDHNDASDYSSAAIELRRLLGTPKFRRSSLSKAAQARSK